MDCVDKTLKIWRSTSFERGKNDCMLAIADYVLLRDGVDFGAKYRGTYTDEAGALDWIEREGGETAMMDASGLARLSQAVRGSIVLIHYAGNFIPGICTGEGVAFRMVRGVLELRLKSLKIVGVWK